MRATGSAAVRAGQVAVLATLSFVRLTEFWRRMENHLGPAYADSWARDQVLGDLGGRTVHEALDAGEDPKLVWRAVCDALRLPASER